MRKTSLQLFGMDPVDPWSLTLQVLAECISSRYETYLVSNSEEFKSENHEGYLQMIEAVTDDLEILFRHAIARFNYGAQAFEHWLKLDVGLPDEAFEEIFGINKLIAMISNAGLIETLERSDVTRDQLIEIIEDTHVYDATLYEALEDLGIVKDDK